MLCKLLTLNRCVASIHAMIWWLLSVVVTFADPIGIPNSYPVTPSAMLGIVELDGKALDAGAVIGFYQGSELRGRFTLNSTQIVGGQSYFYVVIQHSGQAEELTKAILWVPQTGMLYEKPLGIPMPLPASYSDYDQIQTFSFNEVLFDQDIIATLSVGRIENLATLKNQHLFIDASQLWGEVPIESSSVQLFSQGQGGLSWIQAGQQISYQPALNFVGTEWIFAPMAIYTGLVSSYAKVTVESVDDIAETTQAGEVSIINQIAVSGAVWMGGDSDLPVINVTVDLEQNGSTNKEMTDETGAFGYTLTDTSEIILRAEIADRSKPSRSVDVSDIVAMRKHILARERLASVSAMIAADATRDDSIDVTDIVAMRKVILARSDSFSVDGDGNAQPVWRILDAEVVNNATTENVFGGILDGADEIVYNDLSSDITDANFVAVKLGDANQDWSPDSSEAQTTLGARDALQVSDIIRLNAPQTHADGSITIDVHAQATQGLVGMQFGLNWDGQVLRLEGIENHQLPGFSQQAHNHFREGSAQLAWDNALLSNLNLDGNQPVMTLHFALQPGADRGTSIELTQPVLVGSQGSDRAVMGVASYYHPEGGTLLSSQGLIRSMHRSEGSLSLEFATQEGMSYVVESTQDLATGQWEAITTIEGSGRHEVIGMPTTEQAQAYLRVREVSGIVE